MLDIKYIRENPEIVKEGARNKNAKVDIDAVLRLDAEYRDSVRQFEEMRAEQKRKSRETRGESDELKVLKGKIQELESAVELKKQELDLALVKIPNLPLQRVPMGANESGNVSLREVGNRPDFGFPPRDYLSIGEALDIIDVERAAKVSGSRFGYIKGKLAELEFALVRYIFDTLIPEGFIPVVPPVLIKPEAMKAMGYVERGGDEIYYLEKDDMYLVGTSEQSVGPMHMGETFDEKDLPRRYVAFSTCFRREAGSYGKDTKGIIRVHQFDKAEMFSFTKPEDSEAEHQLLLAMEEKLMKGLGIPYRVLDICSGDLGDPAAAKYDIEAWVPSEGKYRETHSTSNTTDYQARRLNIRFKRAATGRPEYVHMLNGTAFAIGRALIAIIENYQTEKGDFRIPDVLQKYMGYSAD